MAWATIDPLFTPTNNQTDCERAFRLPWIETNPAWRPGTIQRFLAKGNQRCSFLLAENAALFSACI
jgi:hypothetical protein